jgi:hypothetical protein
MSNEPRKTAFVLVASDHGTMIVNRFDHCTVASGETFGVGFRILENGRWNQPEVDQLRGLLALRRTHFGDGVVALDCGANIGVHTVEWAKMMTGWGKVVPFEAQERLFYALAGNIVINNCLNARAIHAVLGAHAGNHRVHRPDDRLLRGCDGRSPRHDHRLARPNTGRPDQDRCRGDGNGRPDRFSRHTEGM